MHVGNIDKLNINLVNVGVHRYRIIGKIIRHRPVRES
jgi:hypothetical protein